MSDQEDLTEEEFRIIEKSQINIEWQALRHRRDKLLKKSDDVILLSNLSLEEKEKWENYRQTLRDLPAIVEDPRKIVWPEVPSKE